MPTPSSGPISFQNLRSVFGTGNPVAINTLYRGGTHVPNIPIDNSIPTSGTISLQNFYNAWGNKTVSFTFTVGSHSSGKKKKGALYGAGVMPGNVTFGSISAPTFLTPLGVLSIAGVYFNTGSSSWNLQLAGTSAPVDSYQAFAALTVSGYTSGITILNKSASSASGNVRNWSWVGHGTSHPTSGTISCTLHYFG